MSSTETPDAGIPVIDISNPTPDVAQQVLVAASTHGFLFIKNDGVTIPPQDIEQMFTLSRHFFSQSPEKKSEFAIHSEKAGGKNRGWVQMQGESLDPEGQKHGDPKEAFNIAPPHPALQPLPSPLCASQDLIARFQTACQTLCTRILTLLGTALQIPEPLGGKTWLTTRHDQALGPSGTIFRLLYYPKSSPPPPPPSSQKEGGEEGAKSVLAGAHSDYGSLTLLFRLPGQPGLEIRTRDRTWVPVPVNPSPTHLSSPPVLVNIGDVLSFWTRGMLKSTVHRVVFSGSGEERLSMAYFCHPRDEVLLEGVPSAVIREFGDRGREELESQRERLGLGDGDVGKEEEVLTAGGHLARRLKVTYGLED